MANNITPRRAPGATQPFVNLNPQYQLAKRAPTIYDDYEPSTIWIEQVDVNGNPVNLIWILASVQNGQANWIPVSTAGGDGNFNNIFLPYTNAGGTVGVIYFGGNRFINDYDPVNPGQSTFVGQDAGNFTMVGPATGNVGIGDNALNSVTTGGFLTAIGTFAGASLTTANNCTFVGQGAGLNATIGSFNTVVGCQAYNASEAAPTGDNNSIFGANAAPDLTSGYNNTLIGYSVAASLTSGHFNTVISGGLALSNLVTGSGNIIIGSASGDSYVAAESDNILIGNEGIPGDNNRCRIGTFGGSIVNTYIAGDVFTESNLIALANVGSGGDSGVGTVGNVEFTNVFNDTLSTGAMTVLSTTVNPGNSAGFIKIYVNGVTAYLPYFTNIAP